MIKQLDLAEAKQSLKDDRIRAMLLICPASFAYQPESLKNIKIPVGLIAAINDEVLPYREHAYQIIRYLVPAKLKMMRKEISHYAFLNLVSEEGKKLFQKNLYNDPPCCDRLSIHREVGTFAIDFFREFL
jgi:predicted dienelactone hydrolase